MHFPRDGTGRGRGAWDAARTGPNESLCNTSAAIGAGMHQCPIQYQMIGNTAGLSPTPKNKQIGSYCSSAQIVNYRHLEDLASGLGTSQVRLITKVFSPLLPSFSSSSSAIFRFCNY